MTPTILDYGSWRLLIFKSEIYSVTRQYEFQRQHRHGDGWVRVGSLGSTAFFCASCHEAVPEKIEGYINLVRWACNDHNV